MHKDLGARDDNLKPRSVEPQNLPYPEPRRAPSAIPKDLRAYGLEQWGLVASATAPRSPDLRHPTPCKNSAQIPYLLNQLTQHPLEDAGCEMM